MIPQRILSALLVTAFPSFLLARPPEASHKLRAPANITWVAFTPDSRQLLTGGHATQAGDESDYELRLWDVQTGKLAGGAIAGVGIGASGVVSPDGKTAVTGGTTGEWRTWKLPDLTPIGRGQVGNHRIHRTAFRPDGKAFALLVREGPTGAGVAHSAITLEAGTGQQIGNTVEWPAETTTGPPAGWTLSNGPTFDRLGVVTRPTAGAAAPLEIPDDDERCGGPMARAISVDGKWAVSAGCNGQVVIWDYPPRKVVGKPLASFPRLNVSDPGLAMSADGGRVAIASMAEHGVKGHLLSLTVYDVESRKVVLGPADLGATGVGLVGALAFSPDGSMVALAFSRLGGQIKEPVSEIQLWSVPGRK